MAIAVTGKLQTDLKNFNLIYGEENELVAPS
jgi:mRNA cleavage and polyadenylation factor CLP1 P-loop